MAIKTVVVKGDPIYDEALASEAITPGHLIEYVPSGADAGQVRKHSTASGPASPMFAVEESLVGEGITDAYADGDTTQFAHFRRGDVVYALLGTSEAVEYGNELDSKGDGTLKRRTSGNFPLCEAEESVSNVGGSAAVRVKVKIL